MLRRLLIILLWVILLGGGFVFYWAQDANRFKPQLEELIEARTGVPVDIRGDLAWTLWPPLKLTARDLAARYEGRDYQVGRLGFNVDITTLVRTRDLDRWQVKSLTLNDVTVSSATDQLLVDSFTLRDFTPGQPAPMSVALSYTAAGVEPLPITADGLVTYARAADRIDLTHTRFTAPLANGTCDATAIVKPTPAAAPPGRADELIPVAIWRSFDWTGNCTLDELNAEGQQFTDVALQLDNHDGDSTTQATFPHFFGGQAVVALRIDARAQPLAWTVQPDLEGVDSQQLMRWLDQRFTWIAPLAYGGTLRMQGNTQQELMASLSGETRFDGGQGQISVQAIKQQLLAVSALLNDAERIQAWPDLWNYQRFTGNWAIDHQKHDLNFALDNLTLAATGIYDPGKERMDMRATLELAELFDGQHFDVNPLLVGLPISLRCQGTLADPGCAVDEASTQQLIAGALNQQNSPLKAKLNKQIDEQVPEQFRDAARSLLDMLGDSLQNGGQNH